MHRKNTFPVIIAALLFLTFSFKPMPAQAGEKVVIAVPVLQGLSVGSLSKLLKELAAVISKKTGYDIQIKELSYKKGDDEAVFLNLLKEMKAGADFGYVFSPLLYIKYEKQAADVMAPAIALMLDNSKATRVCAYVRKSSPYKSISELKGKNYGGLHTMQMRYLMHVGGVDSPLKSFFGKAAYIDDTTVSIPFDALLSSRIDVYAAPSYVGKMVFNSNKKYPDGIRELSCAEYEHSWTFYYRKGTPKQIVDKITAEMLKVNKDKDYNQFKFMLSAIKGQFASSDLSELKKTREIAALVAKFGWDKEENEFNKNKPK